MGPFSISHQGVLQGAEVRLPKQLLLADYHQLTSPQTKGRAACRGSPRPSCPLHADPRPAIFSRGESEMGCGAPLRQNGKSWYFTLVCVCVCVRACSTCCCLCPGHIVLMHA